MKNKKENRCWASEMALTRYDAVRYIEEAVRSGLPLRRALCLACERTWGGKIYKIPTLESWYYRYRHGKFAALHNSQRSDKGQRRKISQEAVEALLSMRKKHQNMFVSKLLQRLEQQAVIPPGSVSISTIYRILKEHGLDSASIKGGSAQGPTKAFEFSWPNQLWMADGMHGPYIPIEEGGKCRKTYLLALIDDCSRIVCGQYYTSENIECFLDLFKHALLSRGIPDKLYTDNGTLFISNHLKTVCASCGIRLIHAKPYAAWSKGKIERFFRTVQSDFEQMLVFEPVNSLEELNNRFRKWLEGTYHQRQHRSLQGDSPQKRFMERSANLRIVTPDMDIDSMFLRRITRKVRRDATISINRIMFEVPVALRGRVVEVRYDPFNFKRIEIYVEDKKAGNAVILNKQLNSKTFNKENYENE